MAYRFATKSQDYTDLAAGRILQNFPGHPAFPIRLASEIFQRCLAYLASNNISTPITLYDPCCGGAYLLTTLAYGHWSQISTIIGSDIDPDALKLAKLNLSLLTLDGLEQRLADVKSLFDEFGKESHAEAIRSGVNLRNRLLSLITTHQLQTHLFLADSTSNDELQSELSNVMIDLVITDIPYGTKVAWQGDLDDNHHPPVWHLLNALQIVLANHSIVAVVTDKKQKVAHENYTRIDRFQIGKRRIFILKQKG